MTIEDSTYDNLFTHDWYCADRGHTATTADCVQAEHMRDCTGQHTTDRSRACILPTPTVDTTDGAEVTLELTGMPVDRLSLTVEAADVTAATVERLITALQELLPRMRAIEQAEISPY